MALSSGTTNFFPALSDFVTESFARIGLRSSQIQPEMVIEARRSMNFILSDWSTGRGPNLFAIDLISVPMVPAQATYSLPMDTVQLLDCYLRLTSPDSDDLTTLGNALTPMTTGAGVPMVTGLGDPMIIGPASGVFSTTAGSYIITMTWPSNGLGVGDPIFFTGIISTGGIVLQAMYTVQSVIDQDTLTFQSITPALETQSLGGATPLLQTTASSTTVYAIYPQHGMVVGDTFTIAQATTVGGITFAAASAYTVTAVTNSYQFAFTSTSTASVSTAGFVNSGQIQVTSQLDNVMPIDLIVYGLSRTEYASIPTKTLQSQPTSFWFDRTISPTVTVWPVPQPYAQTNNIYYSLQMYRMRQIQDANPLNGQVGDFPQRFFEAFCASLAAKLAEKYNAEVFKDKLLLAEAAWSRASIEDRELVPLFLIPMLGGYFR